MKFNFFNKLNLYTGAFRTIPYLVTSSTFRTNLKAAAKTWTYITFISSVLFEARSRYVAEEKLHYSFKNESERHAAIAIQQAFKDMEFKGPVYVAFEQNNHAPKFTGVSVIPFLKKGERAAAVMIDPRFIDDKRFPDINSQIYAVAGHEAVHVLHKHNTIYRFSNMFAMAATLEILHRSSLNRRQALLFGFASLVTYMCVIFPAISRQCEKDADLTSAKQLGTRYLLSNRFFLNQLKDHVADRWKIHPTLGTIYFFSRGKQKDELSLSQLQGWRRAEKQQIGFQTISLLDSHPSSLERAIYLRQTKFHVHTPQMFKNKIAKAIEENNGLPNPSSVQKSK